MKIAAKSTKNKFTSAFLATSLIAVPCLNHSLQAENLLKNGDAEAGDISGWTKFIEVSPTAHEGAYSFVLAGAKDSSGTAQSKDFIPVDPSRIRGQSRVLTHFKKSEKFGEWPDNCELNTLGQFTM